MTDLRTAARLTEDQHASRIAAEGRDVVRHPAQQRDEVLHADGARIGELGVVAEIEIAERAQSMIHRDDDAVTEAREHLAVAARRVARATVETAAVKAYEHRTFAARLRLRRPEIQHEAVLAHAAGLQVVQDQVRVGAPAIGGNLRRDVAVVERIANA